MLKEKDVIARALAAIEQVEHSFADGAMYWAKRNELARTTDFGFRLILADEFRHWVADQIRDAIRAEFAMIDDFRVEVIDDFRVEVIDGRWNIRDHSTGKLFGCLAKGGSTRRVTYGKREAAEARAYALNCERQAVQKGPVK